MVGGVVRARCDLHSKQVLHQMGCGYGCGCCYGFGCGQEIKRVNYVQVNYVVLLKPSHGQQTQNRDMRSDLD